jgi:hypothetical protein
LLQYCVRLYEDLGEELSNEEKADIEALTRTLAARNQFVSIFIDRLVPWGRFRRNPNTGHEAIADFLLCGAAKFVISTNFDTHIEDAAARIGEPHFVGAKSGVEAEHLRDRHHQLLKIHGCAYDERNTLWYREQLGSGELKSRVKSSKTWIEANLQACDLLIVGFWTDWAYLNDALDHCLEDLEPTTVILVDPEPDLEKLKAKANDMWSWCDQDKVRFTHIPEGGAAFLDGLRKQYSLQFIKRCVRLGKDNFKDVIGGEYTDEVEISDDFSNSELYMLRRDFTGRPSDEAVRLSEPTDAMAGVGAWYLRLVQCGADLEGNVWRLDDKRIRLIQGGGRPLSRIKAEYERELGTPDPVDYFLCVGALPNVGAASNIIGRTRPGDVVRGGESAQWLTHDEAMEILKP